MEIKGKVKAVPEMQSGVSAKGEWKRQTIVVEYQDGQYTSTVALDNAKKAEEFGKLSVGDEVTFKCNLPTSREYNGRWYTSVNCWGWDVDSKVEEVEVSEPTTVAQEPTPTVGIPAAPATTSTSEDDEPF